jgi:hypothetical protein
MATSAAVALLTIAAFARPGDTGVFEPAKAIEAYSNGSAVANLVAKPGQPQSAADATSIQTDANLPAKEKLALETWKGAVLSAAERDSASASEIKLAEQGTKLAPNPDCYVIMTMDRANACALQGLGTQHVTWPEGVPKTVALLGHSIAAQFRETIASVLPTDVKIVPLTLTSCQLTTAAADGTANRQGVDCGKHNEWAIAQAKKLNPGLVAFSVVLGSKPEDAATQALGKKLEGLPGKKLFIVNAPQTAPFSECINGTSIHACKQTTDVNVLTNIGNAKAFSSKFGLSEFSLADLICKSGQCPPFIKGYPVRFDGQHLTSGMMDRIAPFLASSIQLALKNGSR